MNLGQLALVRDFNGMQPKSSSLPTQVVSGPRLDNPAKTKVWQAAFDLLPHLGLVLLVILSNSGLLHRFRGL